MSSLDTVVLCQFLRIESISGMDYFCTFAPKMVYIKRLPTPSRYWWCAKKNWWCTFQNFTQLITLTSHISDRYYLSIIQECLSSQTLYFVWLTALPLPSFFFLLKEMHIVSQRICPILCCSLLKNEASPRRARWAVNSEIIYSVYYRETKNTKHLIAFLIYKSDSSKGSSSFIFLVLEVFL